MIPQKLICQTDLNELEFVRIIKGKETLYEYRFTKSETKLGLLMTLSESQLEKSLNDKIFKL
jgi:hypothetical protein